MYKLILKFLIIATLFLAVGRVVVSNIISTSGVELGRINEEVVTIRTQNTSLEQELFSKSSLENLATEAAKLGFIDSNENFVLTNPLPIAAR